MNDKMLKSKLCGSIQEVILPDFLDDDDTVTTTVTKSRRVSFGTNFVKEFVVGSAVSAQCVSEYEKAFSSSDSSNANSSQSTIEGGVLGQSTFVVEDNHKPNLEPDEQIKRPKISSTICFTADSPTADMEFTEGCISLAKSILDKKNKEMTVIIQAKPKDSKEDTKISRDEETKFFEGSQFDMSMTKCFKTKEYRKEEKRFESEKTKIFNDEMSFTKCDNVLRMRQSMMMSEEEDNCKENIMPLDMIMRHLDQDNSDLEKSLFSPEKLLAETLNKNPLNFSGESEKLNLNESMDISKDLAPVLFKVPFPVPTPTKNVAVDMSIESRIEGKNVEFVGPLSLVHRNSEDMSIEGNDNEHVFQDLETFKASQPVEETVEMNIASKKDENVIASQTEELLVAREDNEMSIESKDDERAPTATDNPDEFLIPIPLVKAGTIDDVVVNTKIDEPVVRTSEEMLIESKENEEPEKNYDSALSEESQPALDSSISAENEIVGEKTPEPMCLVARSTVESQNEKSVAHSEDNSANVNEEFPKVITDNVTNEISMTELSFTKTENLAMETDEQVCAMEEKDKDAAISKYEAEAEEEKDKDVSENLSMDVVPQSQALEDESKTAEPVSLDAEEVASAEDESFCLEEKEDKDLHFSNQFDQFDGQDGSLSKIDITLSDFINEEAMEESLSESITKDTPEEDPRPPQPTPETSKASLLDSKIIQNVKDQGSEPGCTWKLKEFIHPQNQTLGLLSFDFELLESTVRIEFVLKSSDEDTLKSCSTVSDCRIQVNEDKHFKPPEYSLVSHFGFDKLKKVFEKERKSVKTIRQVPYFLDMMNLFALKNNACMRQVYSILTLYPGSRLKGSTLSFRLYSFPIFFSCTVSIDLTDIYRLSSSCLSFELDFGTFDKTKITRIFEESLKSENALVDFIVRSNQYLVDLEQETGYVSKREHIRLLPSELH